MWQWIPTGFTCLQASASLYAAGICSCGIPNLLVASPVAIFGWVGTSSAGLTRNEISATFPAFAAIASSWWSSSRESSETFTPWLTARARSVGVFELPLKSSFAAGIPASRARASSPAEKISAPAPSRARARITARFPFAFAAKRTCTFSYRLESAAWYCREVLADPVLACHVKRGAVLCRESNAVLTADMEVSLPLSVRCGGSFTAKASASVLWPRVSVPPAG